MGFDLQVRCREKGLSEFHVKGIIGKSLKEGKSFKDAIPSETLTSEADRLVSEFIKLCEEGVDSFKAFVEVFY